MAAECTQYGEGHTTVDIQLSPRKFIKKLPTGDTAQLSDQNCQSNHRRGHSCRHRIQTDHKNTKTTSLDQIIHQ